MGRWRLKTHLARALHPPPLDQGEHFLVRDVLELSDAVCVTLVSFSRSYECAKSLHIDRPALTFLQYRMQFIQHGLGLFARRFCGQVPSDHFRAPIAITFGHTD